MTSTAAVGAPGSPSATPAATSPPHLRLLLVLLCTSLALVLAANLSLALALPQVGGTLGADQTSLTWVIDAYSLPFAALLLPAGIAADRFGRRTLLVSGLVVFGAASIASGYAGSPEVLVALRAVAGLGAAAVFPVTLSALVSAYPDERRGSAVAVWSGVSAAGSVLGLVAGGVLLRFFWWGSVQVAFGVLALLVALAAARVVAQDRNPALSLDVPGALLAVLGLGSLVYGIIEAPVQGWTSPLTLAALGVGVLGLAGFVVRELLAAAPALDVRLFRDRRLSSGGLLVGLSFFTVLGLFVLAPQQLQVVRGLSPLQTALVVLVFSVGAGPGSALAPRAAARLGARWPAVGGLLAMAAGAALLARTSATTPVAVVCVDLFVLGVGFGLAITPGTVLIIEGLPADRRSVASAVNDITREVGGVLGVAVLSTVLNSAYRSSLAPALDGLPSRLADLARSGVGPARGAVDALGPGGEALRRSTEAAFAGGFRSAFDLAAWVLVGAAVVCGALAPPRGSSTGQPAPHDPPRHRARPPARSAASGR